MRLVDLKLSKAGFRCGMGLALGLVVNLACSDDGVPADSTGGGDTAASTSGGTDGQSSASDTSDPSGVTADVTTDSTSAGTATSSDSGPVGTDSVGTTGTSDTDGRGTDTDGTGTTGGMPLLCEVDEDCIVVNDCCSCTAAHQDEDVPDCPRDCFQPTCDAAGIPDVGAVCRFGTCQLEKTTCGEFQVTCDQVPPECSEGLLPQVQDDCWSGNCVPVEACDYVPDCSYCEDDQTCVEHQTQLGLLYACEPIAPACAGIPDCDCMPDVCGGDPFVCADGGDPGQELSCSCPVCG